MFEAEAASLSLAIGAGAQEVTIVAVNDQSACYFRADGDHELSRFVKLDFPRLDSHR